MAYHVIRVELHDANWQQYVDLHKKLQVHNITDIIVAGDGTRYKLPPAEYNYNGSLTRDQVYGLVTTAAAQVVKSYAVVVTEAVSSIFIGLEKV